MSNIGQGAKNQIRLVSPPSHFGSALCFGAAKTLGPQLSYRYWLLLVAGHLISLEVHLDHSVLHLKLAASPALLHFEELGVPGADVLLEPPLGRRGGVAVKGFPAGKGLFDVGEVKLGLAVLLCAPYEEVEAQLPEDERCGAVGPLAAKVHHRRHRRVIVVVDGHGVPVAVRGVFVRRARPPGAVLVVGRSCRRSPSRVPPAEPVI